MIRRLRSALLAIFAVSGASLATPLPAPAVVSTTTPLPFAEINQSTTGQCSPKGPCAELHVRFAEFANQPALNQYLTQTLLEMSTALQEKPSKFESFNQLESYFWNHASPQTTLYLQANVLRSQQELVVVEALRYIFTGGAHGETDSHYVNWLAQEDKILTFKDMLLPGAQTRFELLLQKAHQQWLESQGNAIDDIQAFKQNWPFQSSHNVALMPDALHVTYARYTLAPGSFGQPTLTIPYSDLNGVFKPEILKIAQ